MRAIQRSRPAVSDIGFRTCGGPPGCPRMPHVPAVSRGFNAFRLRALNGNPHRTSFVHSFRPSGYRWSRAITHEDAQGRGRDYDSPSLRYVLLSPVHRGIYDRESRPCLLTVRTIRPPVVTTGRPRHFPRFPERPGGEEEVPIRSHRKRWKLF